MDFMSLGDSTTIPRDIVFKVFWFWGIMEGNVISKKITFFAWFFAFDCFTIFWIRDGWFIDDMIFADSKVLPWYIVLSVLVV